MLLVKTNLINKCVERFDYFVDCETIIRLTIESTQTIANVYIYKQTNQQLLDATRKEQESKNCRKNQNNKTKILNE